MTATALAQEDRKPHHLVRRALDRQTVCGVKFDRYGQANPGAYPHMLAGARFAPGRQRRIAEGLLVICPACLDGVA